MKSVKKTHKYFVNKQYKNKPFKMCSCHLCGNARRNYGKTKQELAFEQAAQCS